MEVFQGHQALFRPLVEAVVTIGNFDGVHCGHRELLRRARIAADEHGGDAVAMTFDPHPAACLVPNSPPPRLTTLPRKLELFADAKMSCALVQSFDRDFAKLSARDFEEQVLGKSLQARHVVVGHDFGYGSGRSGDVDSLRASGRRLGYEVEIVAPLHVGSVLASSSAVRRALVIGDLQGASALLGRHYDVEGTVVRGAGRGRDLGVATANIDTGDLLLPAPGIYATLVTVLGDWCFSSEKHRTASSGSVISSGCEANRSRKLALNLFDTSYRGAAQCFMAATSLGTNPTFVDGGALTLEAHLLDFDQDLYDKELRVTFVQRLRGEERYPDIDALLSQIRLDVERTREILRTHTRNPKEMR